MDPDHDGSDHNDPVHDDPEQFSMIMLQRESVQNGDYHNTGELILVNSLGLDESEKEIWKGGGAWVKGTCKVIWHSCADL